MAKKKAATIKRKSKTIKFAHPQGEQPGVEAVMNPRPEYMPFYKGVGKFKDKVVLISGGDSGIGRATTLAFANEGAKVAIIYKDEDTDAEETRKLVEKNFKGKCLLIRGDLGDKEFCFKAVDEVIESFGRLDILINNAAEQHEQEDLVDISQEQLLRTFKTNIFAYIYLSQAALRYLPENEGVIINTTSITAYRGHDTLIDYSATKGSIVTFTRSLAANLAEKGIRVNGVAPGPIWTPLIPASFDKETLKKFGKNTPMKRAGQPCEVAGAYTFLASQEASYITGQVIHPNGGQPVGG